MKRFCYFFAGKPSVDDTESISQTIDNEVADGSHIYAEYILDLWHHISKRVDPEDIGRFALICRQTAYVTSTTEFWKCQYRKHATADKLYKLPKQLQPNCVLNSVKGLRTNVVRTLFLTYQPFIERMDNLRQMEKLSNQKIFTQDQLEQHPVYEKLQQNAYIGKVFTKEVSQPESMLKQKSRKRCYNYDYTRCLPKIYFNLFYEMNNETIEFPYIHQTEEIFDNVSRGCVLLLLKTLSKSNMKVLRTESKNDNEVSNVFHSMAVLSPTAKRPELKLIPTTDLRLEFKEPERRSAYTFAHTTQFGLFNWWDPMYECALTGDF